MIIKLNTMGLQSVDPVFKWSEPVTMNAASSSNTASAIKDAASQVGKGALDGVLNAFKNIFSKVMPTVKTEVGISNQLLMYGAIGVVLFLLLKKGR